MANQLIIDIPRIMLKKKKEIRRALPIVGAAMVDAASKQLKANNSVVSGNLLNSLTYSTQKVAQKPSKGSKLKKPKNITTVKTGTSVVYAPRVEFGFSGEDSLGRVYDQPAKSFLRSAMQVNKKKFVKILEKALRKNG